jgi:hypothetical protein
MFTDHVNDNRAGLDDHVRNIVREKSAIQNCFLKQIQKDVLLLNPIYKRMKEPNPSQVPGLSDY